MTARAEYLALAERAERAEGADGILDADILAATHPELSHPQWERVTYPNGRWAFYADRSDPDGLNIVHTPAFTASLNAALSLVPEGLLISLLEDPRVSRAFAHLRTKPLLDPDKQEWSGYAKKLPLALVAAALRARAAEGEG